MRIRSVRSCIFGTRKLMKHPGLNEIVLLLCAVFLSAACGGSPGSSTTNSSSAPSPSPTVQPSPLTGFEKDLQFIRNGRFTYVYVFSRKDGKLLDAQDGAFLRTNAPQVV